MQTSTKRRVFGVLGLVLATQVLSACIVLPVPAHRRGVVVVQPGYGYGHQGPPPDRQPYWRR
jgi:hypothetical protein